MTAGCTLAPRRFDTHHGVGRARNPAIVGTGAGAPVFFVPE